MGERLSKGLLSWTQIADSVAFVVAVIEDDFARPPHPECDTPAIGCFVLYLSLCNLLQLVPVIFGRRFGRRFGDVLGMSWGRLGASSRPSANKSVSWSRLGLILAVF